MEAKTAIDLQFAAYKSVLEVFQQKHNLEFTHFTQNDWTSYACFGSKYHFSFQDIVRDIKNDRPINGITTWFDNNEKAILQNLDYNEYCELKSIENGKK